MAKVVKYQAEDGSLFDKAEELRAYETGLRVKASAVALVVKAFGQAEDEVVDFIVDNAADLRKLLNDASSVKRGPRKPKAVEEQPPLAKAA